MASDPSSDDLLAAVPDAFSLWFDHGEDRAVALTLPVLLEHVCEQILREAFRKDKTIAAEFFRPTGPLGNYGTKVRMIYMLGFIADKTYKDLLTIGKIRNRFAHDMDVKTFDQEPIKSWITQMHVYKVMISGLDKPIPDDSKDKAFLTAMQFTLRHQLELREGPFRESVRMYYHMLHRLIRPKEEQA